MSTTPRMGGNPSPDQPRVPHQKRHARDRKPGPERDRLPADEQARQRKTKKSNDASTRTGRSTNNRRQAPPRIADVAHTDEQAVAAYTGNSGRAHRRSTGKPPMAGKSIPTGRPAVLATLLDFHERRADTTSSVDEEIRLLRAHVRSCLTLMAPFLILILCLLAAFMASALGVSLLKVITALGASTAAGATGYLLRARGAGRGRPRKRGHARRRDQG